MSKEAIVFVIDVTKSMNELSSSGSGKTRLEEVCVLGILHTQYPSVDHHAGRVTGRERREIRTEEGTNGGEEGSAGGRRAQQVETRARSCFDTRSGPVHSKRDDHDHRRGRRRRMPRAHTPSHLTPNT